MTWLVDDPVFLKHDTGAHPEHSSRLLAISRALDARGLRARCKPLPFHAAQPEDTFAVHQREQFERLQKIVQQGGGHLDPDTVVSPGSLQAALAAVGAVKAAADAVLTTDDKTALCLVRPPGHHATESTSMGFCLFNNVALLARHAQQKHNIEKILIVDWDVHHGNGTQNIFYRDPSVFFFSIHRYPFYPGTGAADEVGEGKGRGTTMNVPIEYGEKTNAEYCIAFTAALHAAAARAKPELIIISAGFDAHRSDPIGSLDLESEDFALMTKAVKEAAGAYAQGRIVSCLEGGYHLDALADSASLHLEALLNA